jgi:EAL domain-containing protein (putative c-di-GMP-specific phosphodiesterase class I)
VRLIVLLAQALGLEICAEGVETFEERDFLKELGVRSFQGFLASPALAFDSFLSWRSGAPGNHPPSLVSRPIGAGLK